MRRRRNKIEALVDVNGRWVEEKGELERIGIDFYKELFIANPNAGGRFIQGRFPQILRDAIQILQADCTLEELARALKGMGLLKAPGPDGFQPILFKRTWEIMGKAIFKFAGDVLGEGSIPSESTEDLLVLIPKKANPGLIRNFRPISLCNVSLKLVTKMIVNRLKVVLRDTIGPNLTAFVPGRQGISNFLICQEILHTLRYTRARRGGMILKMDLDKAYDLGVHGRNPRRRRLAV